jgi:SAM-dependent methyltransferase
MSIRTELEWPVTFFDDDYLRIYNHSFTPDKTAAEVEFIGDTLALPHGSKVLDLACGVGRHAIGMARRGFRVTGVDFNARYLERAAHDAHLAGADVRWLAADMRELSFEREFAGVYSFFTSFGYFSDAENEQVLARITRSLEAGGQLLLDLINRERLLLHPQHRTWDQRDDGSLMMEEVTFDVRRSRVISRLTLIESQGPRLMKEFELRVYTCAELTALLARHGLEVRAVWGGADRSDYGAESRRLVILAARVA